MNFNTLILIVSFYISVTMISCNHWKLTNQENFYSSASTQNLIEQLQPISEPDKSLSIYLDTLFGNQLDNGRNGSVVLLGSRVPVAFAIDSTSAAISCGIIKQSRSEDQLVFILAHEAAHILLRHFDNREAKGRSIESEELEADSFALMQLVSQGYSISGVGQLLLRMQMFNKSTEPNYIHYPDYFSRNYNWKKVLDQSSIDSRLKSERQTKEWYKLVQYCSIFS